MSRQPTEQKKSDPKIDNLIAKKYKIFAVNFFGSDLETIAKELTKTIEVGKNKTIFQVTMQDSGGEQMSADETKKILHQIDLDIEKCKKDFEATCRRSETGLEGDLKKFWKGGSSNEELESDQNEVSCQSMQIIPRKLNDLERRLFYSEIEEKDINTPDFFVILFGRFPLDILTELIMSSRPLIAIIHFIPCQEADLKVNFPELHSNIDFLRKYSNAKDVGVFIETLTPKQGCMEEGCSQKIYDQFTWYLYDIEMLAQQFTAYETDFVEIRDGVDASQEQIGLGSVRGQSKEDFNDDTAVAVYLTNLFDAIEDQTLRMKTFSCPRTFLENSHGKVIIEDANEVLSSAIATRMNVVSYWRVVDILLHGMNMEDSFLERSFDVQLPRYYELLSWETFIQMLAARKSVYDKCCRVDMTEGCKLYVLQRTFNKIVDVKRKFRLPTKLGFRDFCDFVAPDLAGIIRQYKSQKEAELENGGKYDKNSFCGFTFDGAVKELNFADKLYRFQDGFVRCSIENWRHRESMLSLEIRLFDCTVLNHRWEGFTSLFPQVRIITRNDITCTVSLKEDSDHADISIQWPNRCQIRYLNEGDVNAIEQLYPVMKNNEHKRFYTPEGCVIIFLVKNQIDVLTPNGIIYKLYPNGHTDHENNDPAPNVDVTKEVSFVKDLSRYGIDCVCFDVTRSDGKKLRVFNGEVVQELAHYLAYEWLDYSANEWYAERDDGVRMIWSSDCLKCYYTCGTVITTTVTEHIIEMKFGCRSPSMEKFLKQINPDLVKMGANKANRLDTFVGYNTNYLMQHKHFANVAVYNDGRMVIYSPDDLRVIIEREKNIVKIDIGETLAFRVTAGLCTIVSGKSIPEEKSFSVNLTLSPESDEILSFQNKNAFVTLQSNGEMNLNNEQEPLEPHTEEMYFLSKRRKFGLAFLPDKTFQDVTTNFKDKTYLYDSPTKTVLLKPIVPIEEKYSMPIPDFQANLTKFKTACERPVKTEEEDERVLKARTILKLDRIPDDVSIFMRNFPFTEKTFEDNLGEALDVLLKPKVKSRYSLEWKEKIDSTRKELESKKRRFKTYNATLRRNVFPKYHEFKNSQKNFKIVDKFED